MSSRPNGLAAISGLRTVSVAALASLAFVLAPALVPTLAHAQVHAPLVHGGVAVDALTPAGLVRTDATVPVSADVPVRLTFASQPGAPNEVLVGVLVGANATAAHAALDHYTNGIQREVPRDGAVGELTVHVSGDTLAFIRDNVFVSVRVLSGTHDVTTLARAIDAAVVASPSGETRAATPSLQVGARIVTSDHRLAIYSLLPAGGAVALEVRALRSGLSVYRTSHGWFVRVRDTSITPSASDFAVHAVDARLRVTAH